ncbi:MAG TPA: alpha/beta hydrolase [Planctomycetaceae bacterium]|nr:alpha/beta hydrolase [Planctomycetaceae bacterium]
MLCCLLPLFAPGTPRLAAAQDEGQSTKPARVERRLWEGAAPGALGERAEDIPRLLIELPTPEKRTGAAIVVLPGGGYGGLAMGHEGHEIAAWLTDHGIAAFICDYRHRGKGYGHPAPLLDAQRAVRTVRAEAERFSVDPARIGIIGFSAGGHLASTVATHFDAGDPAASDPIDQVSSRPDFAILCYPVISFDEAWTHRGSQQNLLGESPDPDLVRKLSNEKSVTAENPPTFLWHTTEDQVVPVENAIRFYQALERHDVPCELLIFERGRHGLGLARGIRSVSSWPDRCLDWMTLHGWLPETP